MSQQICLITGATDGVGKVTALELAEKGFIVVLVARNPQKAQRVREEITAAVPGAMVDFIVADLMKLKDIHRMVELFRKRYDHLDVLINNAGVVAPRLVMTEDRYESTYQVNYLAQFFLANLLVDHLEKSAQGRIINLCSSVFTMGKFKLADQEGGRDFSSIGRYADSKLLVFMFTMALAERLKGTRITANAVHPGVVRTQMMFRAPGLLKAITLLAFPFSVSPQKGAATSVYLATSTEVAAISGKYFKSSKIAAVNSKFNTPENRALLWERSMAHLDRSRQEFSSSH